WDSTASFCTLAAAGLARSWATSTPATMRAAAGNGVRRPCGVSARSASPSRLHAPRHEEMATGATTIREAWIPFRVPKFIVRRMSWIRMRFKGERVFVRADESGKPELDATGRAEMKYRESDDKSYRPFGGNLLPDDEGGGGAVAARPSSSSPS